MNDDEGLRLKNSVEGGTSRDKGGNLPRYPGHRWRRPAASFRRKPADWDLKLPKARKEHVMFFSFLFALILQSPSHFMREKSGR